MVCLGASAAPLSTDSRGTQMSAAGNIMTFGTLAVDRRLLATDKRACLRVNPNLSSKL